MQQGHNAALQKTYSRHMRPIYIQIFHLQPVICQNSKTCYTHLSNNHSKVSKRNRVSILARIFMAKIPKFPQLHVPTVLVL